MQRVGILFGGETPVRDEDFVEQRGRGALDHRAEILPAFLEARGPHIFPCDIVAADQCSAVVEDRDFAVIAEIGESPGGKG